MDETTHPFSRKVLDRAFCMEFADADLSAPAPPRREPPPPLAVRASDLASPPLRPAPALRATSMQVAWRARDEILRYLYWNRLEELLPRPSPSTSPFTTRSFRGCRAGTR